MMLFQLKLGWSSLELLGRSADSGCPTPLKETKRIGGGSPVASSMPKSVLSGGRENLGNEFLVRTAHRWDGLVFIMGDHDNFPSWMIIQNDIFPCWRMIRYFFHWARDFLSLSLTD